MSGLKIKYYISSDRYGGNGVFPDQDIKKGELVWKFDDANICIWKDSYCKQLFKTFDDKTLTDILTYNYFRHDFMIDMRFDNGRYINHSKDPNILSGYEINRQFGFEKYKDDELLNSYAIKDISKDMEILDDYNTYSDSPEWIKDLEKKLNIDNDYLK